MKKNFYTKFILNLGEFDNNKIEMLNDIFLYSQYLENQIKILKSFETILNEKKIFINLKLNLRMQTNNL